MTIVTQKHIVTKTKNSYQNNIYVQRHNIISTRIDHRVYEEWGYKFDLIFSLALVVSK